MQGDIFISYARKDDQAVREVIGSKGLVSSLHDRLLANFEALGAPRPTVFRDTKQIAASDQFEPRLGAAIGAAKVLLVVLSRNWLESEWCRRELETFVGHWQRAGESELRIKERIVVVRKHAVPPAQHPSWLQGQSGFDLMSVDPENKEESEYFASELGRPRDERWFTSIGELARDLRRRTHQLPREPGNGERRMPSPPSPLLVAHRERPLTVYVARPAGDMEQSYATLVEELCRRGVTVVPDPHAGLPTQGTQTVAVIDAALAAARLSIHLLGDRLGFQPDDATPIVRLQLERAAERVAAPSSGPPDPGSFHRLIWAPRVIPGSPDDIPARDLFEVLARHSTVAPGSRPEGALGSGDRLDGDTLTKFMQFVLQHLDEIDRPVATRPPPIEIGAQIYVQHDELDAAVAETVAEGLERLGFAPLLPVIEADAAGRQQIHRDSLQTADAVVLCWSRAAPVWIRATASELRRWQDLGRSKAFVTRAVVALPPHMLDKDRLRKFPPRRDIDDVIDATGAATGSPEELDSFLRQLRGSFRE